MSKQLFKYPLIALILISMSTCKTKDCVESGECPPEFYNYTLDSAKAYIWAEAGSWWIYKNTANGDMDTVISQSYYVDTIFSKGKSMNVEIKYQRMFNYLSSSHYNWYFSMKTGGYSPDEGGHPISKIRLLRYVKSGVGLCFFYPFDTTIRGGDGFYTSRYYGTEKSIEIQGKVYSNVVKFYVDPDPTWGENPTGTATQATYYWVKDVGLVKREAKYKAENWELVDYHLVR